MNQIFGSVLDASALLAYLQDEPGSEAVQEAISSGAAISLVNYAEVLSRLSDAGERPVVADRRLRDLGLVGGLVELLPITEDDAVNAAELRLSTRALGLSLGDRMCLAMGGRMGLPVLTADRVWAEVGGVDVKPIRP